LPGAVTIPPVFQASVVTSGEVGDESGPSILPGEFPSSESSQSFQSGDVLFIDWIKSKNLNFRKVADVKGRVVKLPDNPEFFTYEKWKGKPDDNTTYFFVEEKDLVIYYHNVKGDFEFISRKSI
jgi:hypothetical protein